MNSEQLHRRTAHLRRAEITIVILAVLSPALHAVAEPPPAADGTSRMATMLKEIADQADPRANVTVKADERIAYHMNLFESGDEVPTRISNGIIAGIELIRAGKPDEAMTQFSRVRRFLQANNVPLDQQAMKNIGSVLVTTQLRRAEQSNCVLHCSRGSCLLPIREDGIHKNQDGSRTAIKTIEMMLKMDPNDLAMRWLLSICYMTVGEYPDKVPPQWVIPPATFQSEYDIKAFPNVAQECGINVLGLSGGSVMEDFDRDGLIDIMASDWGLNAQLRLFRNKGDGTFEDTTESAGLIGELGGLNLIHADYNNDGFADVFVLRGAWLGDNGRHPNSLLRNNGDDTFTDVTESAAVFSRYPTQTAAWADFNNDGWVDLFIGNESTRNAYPCELYRNNGNGTFTNVAAEAGLDHVGFVKGSSWGDFDNDGRPDLYISRMNQANVLYRNVGPQKGVWRFEDVTDQAGVGSPERSFATWWWDYDNDGNLDLFSAAFSGFEGNSLSDIAADYLGQPNSAPRARLYRNRGDGTFEDVSKSCSIDKAMLAMGANFGDLDNDGWLDMYLGTGEPSMQTLVPNRMYRNDGSKRFQNVTWSGRFGHLQKGHAISFGDIDNDGDQDIYAVMGGAYTGDVAYNALFLNPGHDNHWITLRLEGTRANRAGIGARIIIDLETPQGPTQIHRTVSTGGSFGSSTLQQEIGLGKASAISRIRIRWPGDDEWQSWKDVTLDRMYIARQDAADLKSVIAKQVPTSDHLR